MAAGKQVVLIVDEAQAMPEKTIEALRLLTNLETETTKLFQVVLFGQPELDELLGRTSLRQLRQRITVRYHLRQLTRQEVGQFLAHRLTVAGANGAPYFSSSALRKVYSYSNGIPRLVNAHAYKCLLAGFVHETDRIDRRLVVIAIRELEGKN